MGQYFFLKNLTINTSSILVKITGPLCYSADRYENYSVEINAEFENSDWAVGLSLHR